MNSDLIILAIIFCFSCGNKKYKSQHEDGSIKKSCELIDDNILKCTEYYPSGVVRMKAQYKGDKLDGERRLYDSSGFLIEVADYREGSKEGRVNFYEDDKLISIYDFVNDKAHGRFSKFNKDGSLKERGQYLEGKPVGKHFFYDSVGNFRSIREYKIVRGTSYFNQWWNFDKDSTVIAETSHFATIELKEDSVKFELTAPYFEGKGKVLIGNFDSQFKVASDTLILPMIKKQLTINRNVLPYKIDTLRVIIQDYQGEGNNMIIKNIYFEAPI